MKNYLKAKYRTKTTKLYIISIASTIFRVLFFVTIQRLLDSVINNKQDELFQNIIITLSVAIFYGLFMFLTIYEFRLMQHGTKNTVRKKLYENMINNDLIFFDNYNELNIKVMQEGNAIAGYNTSGKADFYYQLTALIIYISVIFYYNIKISAIILVAMFISFIIMKSLSKIYSKHIKNNQQQFAKLNTNCNETIKGVMTMKSLFIEKFFNKQFLKEANKYDKTNTKLAKITSRYSLINNFVTAMLPLLIIILGAYMISNNETTIGTIILIYSIVPYLREPLDGLAARIGSKNRLKVSRERIKHLLEKSKENQFNGLSNINKIEFNIEELTINKTLINVNTKFNVDKGEIVLIKGETGSGKSTLLKTFINYSKVSKGFIKINDKNINEINLSKSQILYLPQKAFVFEGTIKENIVLDKEYKQEELDKVIKICNLEDVIKRNTFEYNVEEKTNLSGGEIQRIAMARILLLNPKLLIFDESLNSLDKNTAKIVLNNIKEYIDETHTTLLIISYGNLVDHIANKIINLK